jgi:glyoxylase-like metal-dependent hydrolase (beta-lactamase superfamily II)
MPRLAIAALLATGFAYAQPNRSAANAEVHSLKVRGDIYMLVGAGGNITVSVTSGGVVLVDSGLVQMSDKVMAAIRNITDQPVRYIINTHVHADHTGGNEKIAAAGSTLAGGNFAGTLTDASMGAAIFAQESVFNRMSAPPAAGQPAIPFRALPTDTYHSGEMRLSGLFHGEPIRIIHQPSAHTDGDSIVVFTRTDVISTGDLFTTTGYPFVDLQRGGSIQGIINGLNRLLDLALPDFRSEGGTMIIPGHGRLCDMADVAYYRDMVTIVRDRVADMIKKDMTLEQVKAANPTLDYDPRYGNPDRFIEGVYRSLNRGK